MRKHLAALLCFTLLLCLSACARRPSDGFKPPIPQDPLQFHLDNWMEERLISGAWALDFTFSDGDRIGLRADMVVQTGQRMRVDLSSDRGNEAIVTLTDTFVNLLNYRDKYFLREPASAEISERMVGIPLPSQEAASIFSGEGFAPGRFEHIYDDAAGDGGIRLRLFHASEDIRANGYIDQFGRLRNISYVHALTDERLLDVTYLDFRKDRATGLVWPGRIEMYLARRGEKLVVQARDVDIDNDWVSERLQYTFSKLENRRRLQLEDIPPGAPLLYRDLRVYLTEDGK